MRFSKTPGVYALTAIVALFLIGGTAGAAASFAGQGTVPFDSIKVGKNDSKSEIQLQGPIKNPGKYPGGKGRPVNISDDLTLKGNITVQNGDLLFSGTTNGWIRTPGTGIVGIDDDLIVKGLAAFTGGATANNLVVTGITAVKDINITGVLAAGSYNVGATIASNAALTNRLSSMISCVGTFAQITSVLESDDYIFCFNTWMSGQPGSVTIASQAALTDLQRAQVAEARATLSADPVDTLTRSFRPLRSVQP